MFVFYFFVSKLFRSFEGYHQNPKLLLGDVQMGRKWQSGLKNSMCYVGHVYQCVFYAFHLVKKKICQYYWSIEFKINYGEGVDQRIFERSILTDFKACKACDVKVPVGKKFYFYTSLVCLVGSEISEIYMYKCLVF